MKFMLIASILAIAFTSAAQAAEKNAESLVRQSKQFKKLESKYAKVGGSFTCSDFTVVSSTDLDATLPGYTMVAQAVVASCAADPKDGLGDAIQEKLLAFVTVTTSHLDKSTNWNVSSVSIVTPPQPD